MPARLPPPKPSAAAKELAAQLVEITAEPAADWDGTTPTATGKCICGDDSKPVKTGAPLPDRPPLACVRELGGAFWWCCTLEVGEVRITPAFWKF